MITKQLLQMAKGEIPADLVLKNGMVLNLFTNEIVQADVAMCGDTIVGIGHYSGKTERDITGKYVAPGFIDAHLHIESSMITPARFAGEVLPWGTTTLITDPHEIANVSGLQGIRFLLDQIDHLPINLYIMLPSCVPATNLEDSGAILNAEQLLELKNHPNVLGLGEMMNYFGVIHHDKTVFDKLNAFDGCVIDGHAPMLSGGDLQAYKLAGIQTDHECSDAQEVVEKLRAGFFISVREGSAAKNLETIIKAVQQHNLGFDRMAFCTDDKHIGDINREGHIRYNIKKAIELGVDTVSAYKMGSYNAAQFYGLRKLGAVAVGYQADLVILDDLEQVLVESVYCKGRRAEHILSQTVDYAPCPQLLHSVNIGDFSADKLILNTTDQPFPAIEIVPNQIVTKCVMEVLPQRGGVFVPDKQHCKIAVIERHHATGKVGVGVVKGFPIHGAIATTVAHDSHNLIVIGDNDDDMLCAIQQLARCQGGYTLAQDKQVVATLELPICGLMTDMEPAKVEEKLAELLEHAHKMGVPKEFEPFITMSFLALPVIPEIRITDRGIVKV